MNDVVKNDAVQIDVVADIAGDVLSVVDDFVDGADHALTPERNLEATVGDIFKTFLNDARVQGPLVAFMILGGIGNAIYSYRKRQREFKREQLHYVFDMTTQYSETQEQTNARHEIEKAEAQQVALVMSEIELLEKCKRIFQKKKDNLLSSLIKKSNNQHKKNLLELQNKNLDLQIKTLEEQIAIKKNQLHCIQSNLNAEYKEQRANFIKDFEAVLARHNTKSKFKLDLDGKDSQPNNYKLVKRKKADDGIDEAEDAPHAAQQPESKFKQAYKKLKDSKAGQFFQAWGSATYKFFLVTGMLLGNLYMGLAVAKATSLITSAFTATEAVGSISVGMMPLVSLCIYGGVIVAALGITIAFALAAKRKRDAAQDKQLQHDISRTFAAEAYFKAIEKKHNLTSDCPEFDFAAYKAANPIESAQKQPEAVARLQSKKTRILDKFFHATTGLVVGYALMQVCTLIATLGVALAFPATAMPLAIGIAAASACYGLYKLYQGYKQAKARMADVNKQINDKKEVLSELSAVESENAKLRATLFNGGDKLISDNKIKNHNDITFNLPREGLSNNRDFWAKLSTKKTPWYKRVGSVLREFFYDGLVLSYDLRNTLPSTVPASAVAISTGATIGVYGAFKIGHYFFEKDYQRDLAYLNSAGARLDAAKCEYKHLQKLINRAKDQHGKEYFEKAVPVAATAPVARVDVRETRDVRNTTAAQSHDVTRVQDFAPIFSPLEHPPTPYTTRAANDAQSTVENTSDVVATPVAAM